MQFEISGQKVMLRRLRPRFTAAVFEAARESRGGEFTRWMPWCHENYELAETEAFIEICEQNRELGKEYNYAVFDAADDEFAGLVSLNLFDASHKSFNLGYWIRTSRMKRGLAAEATRLLAECAFRELELNRIEIVAAVENAASRKTAEKAGARFEGIARRRLVIGGRVHDAAVFSFTADDF